MIIKPKVAIRYSNALDAPKFYDDINIALEAVKSHEFPMEFSPRDVHWNVWAFAIGASYDNVAQSEPRVVQWFDVYNNKVITNKTGKYFHIGEVINRADVANSYYVDTLDYPLEWIMQKKTDRAIKYPNGKIALWDSYTILNRELNQIWPRVGKKQQNLWQIMQHLKTMPAYEVNQIKK